MHEKVILHKWWEPYLPIAHALLFQSKGQEETPSRSWGFCNIVILPKAILDRYCPGPIQLVNVQLNFNVLLASWKLEDKFNSAKTDSFWSGMWWHGLSEFWIIHSCPKGRDSGKVISSLPENCDGKQACAQTWKMQLFELIHILCSCLLSYRLLEPHGMCICGGG